MSLYHIALYSCFFVKSYIIIKMLHNKNIENLVEGGFCLFYFSKDLLSNISSADAVGIGTVVLAHLKGAFSPVSTHQ